MHSTSVHALAVTLEGQLLQPLFATLGDAGGALGSFGIGTLAQALARNDASGFAAALEAQLERGGAR
jgi:hypothetical protein